ncbi:MAG TPA: plastocyanin/azurin family copper-binding protein [Acidimicrobiia bacterium]|nr:plastocyanin/azurin family copper-binding protein [Acidimicrobiia bacterium]
MRKGMWSVAALSVLLMGAVGLSGPVARAADSTVMMGSSNDPLKFLPPEITVPVGGTVEWRNDTDFQHDVVADDGSFESKLLNKGEKYEFRFTKPGEFTYICTPHESAGMKGVVKVTGGAAPAPTPAPTSAPAPAPNTPAPASASTPTTARQAAAAAGGTTGTTSKATAGGPTTTTTAGLGVTSTTQAASTTPTSAPETAGESPAQSPAPVPTGDGAAETAATDHSSEGGSEKKHEESSPLGIAFAGISTVLLMGISGKLLASKS